MCDNDTDSFIPTRGSKLHKKAHEKFQFTTYTSYKPKVQSKSERTPVVNSMDSETEIFNIKQAKHEIVKFGMSGLDAKQKEEAKVQLLIRLGAKPRKNKSKNYKQLLEEKKKAKQAEKAQLTLQQLGKNSLGMSTARKGFNRKNKKTKLNLLDSYGKVDVKQIPKKR